MKIQGAISPLVFFANFSPAKMLIILAICAIIKAEERNNFLSNFHIKYSNHTLINTLSGKIGQSKNNKNETIFTVFHDKNTPFRCVGTPKTERESIQISPSPPLKSTTVVVDLFFYICR